MMHVKYTFQIQKINNMEHRSRPIIITGANGGIGRKLVDCMLAQGYENVICQVRSCSYDIKQVFAAHGVKDNFCYDVELTNEEKVAQFHSEIKSRFGNIWGLINLAGAASNSMSWKLDVSEFTRIMNENLLSTFLMCREFTPDLRSQAGGRIINTSSVVAFSGAPGASHYCAAKAAIVGFSKSLAIELAPKNITVNTLGLGYFECGLINQIPQPVQEDIKSKTLMKRLGKVEEIAGLVDYLLSDAGGFSTGQVHHVNGGFY